MRFAESTSFRSTFAMRTLIVLAAALLSAPASGLRAQDEPADTAAVETARADTAAADPIIDFAYDLADPGAAMSALLLGLYDHARTEPEEWGGGADALGARIASRAGGHVIGTSVRHGVAYWLGRSTKFEDCGCERTEDRVAHVFVETFTDRDRSGRRVFSEPFIAGTYAGALAPALWHPDVTLEDGLRAGTLSIAFTLAGRIFFELLEPLVQTQAGAQTR
jgi:hypothetical protein